MSNNLIIGDTSQLSHYFPTNYQRISSRNINFDEIKKNKYDRIYLLFSEQRTFLNDDITVFNKVNFNKTIDAIDELKSYCNKIVIYATSELWNNVSGCIDLQTPFNYNYTHYIKSKENLVKYIQDNKNEYENVIIVYPFNFNSVHRKPGFLFYKVFDSIINKNKNSIGDVDFNRDLIHPSVVANASIKTDCDVIVGSGQLINVKKFIYDLFDVYNLNMNEYLTIDTSNNLNTIRNEYYSCEKKLDYDELIKLTLNDICQLN
jgi:nucleoside-diphosphate-sugar epimerase